MSAPLIIPPHVHDRQIEASDPAASVWVAANAGSGKTHVLAQRVIRLLLQGVDPAKILCITFTKAAAANMAMRVFNTLAAWTTYDDAALNRAIAEIGDGVGAEARARARRLFALALETPGGLKVQTIHAFCTRLLHQFPFEADVAARFAVLDEATERQLLDQLSLDVLLQAASHPDGLLGRALATAIENAADQTFRDVINEAIGKRDDLQHWLRHTGGVTAAIDDLSRSLGIDAKDTKESIEIEFFSGPHITTGEWRAITAALAEGSANDREQAARLKRAESASGESRLNAYLLVFCNKEFEPRKNIVTKAIANRHPDLTQRLFAEQKRVCALHQKRIAVSCRDRTAALITIANAVIARYQVEKDRRGLLDYDDLIDKTLALFARTSAAWVLYKLDLGVDHVLIDEAQDTSPKQWEIIATLVGEFTAGAGARGVRRTLFAVGDDKQSIFSFQGAAPLQFETMRGHFAASFTAAELHWRNVKLQTSFRSGSAILGAVDKVFSRPQAYEGLSADAVQTVHAALPETVPGMVEIWDTTKPEEKLAVEPWDAPFDAVSETSPQVQLAQRIARHVRRSLHEDVIGKSQRPLQAGDVLILVRQRGPLFEAIIRALKKENIPVAGADRLVLTDHIAIMDLIALADALLLPEDDLALASVLKSPLFGFDDDDLFALAWERGRRSLRQALLQKADDDPRFAQTARQIERLADAARRDSPFAFYARVLGPLHGRRKILARLGTEAADALDEFLNLALAYESRETPSLQGFVAWLRAARAEVKRDMEMSRDEVRVMTVHGAKGLEAPVVILADTTSAPAGPSQRQPKLFAVAREKAAPGTPPRLLWAGRKENDVPALTQARENARHATSQEYRRLLYVAMTRAAERLIVCGAQGQSSRPEGCWYDLVYDALQPLATEISTEDGTVWRYGAAQPARAHDVTRTPADHEALPSWLAKAVAAEKQASIAVTPSGFGADDEQPAHRAENRQKALVRGRLVHRLMQSLPDLMPARRAQTARAYLSRTGTAFDEAEREAMIAQTLAILDDPRFAPLFAPGSRAEVPIVGRIARPGQPVLAVSGQVDRLAVTESTVLIVDYKTNAPAPQTLAETPAGYLRQLALYRAVLGQIYPRHAIRSALVWTDIPDLMEIPASALQTPL